GKATGCNPVQVGSTPTGVFMSTISKKRSNGRCAPSVVIMCLFLCVWSRGISAEAALACSFRCTAHSLMIKHIQALKSCRARLPIHDLPSLTVEHYVKTIALIAARDPSGSAVATGELAQALNVSTGTVTGMLKTLSEANLATYTPYEGARLTDAGQ